MLIWGFPSELLDRIMGPPDVLSEEEFEMLLRDEPHHIQIDMEADSRGEYVPVGITYLFDVEI